MTVMDSDVSDNVAGRSKRNGEEAVSAARILSRVRAVILLAGIVRTTNFNDGIKRSVLGLPLDANVTVLRHWYDSVCRLGKGRGNGTLPLRILVDSQSPLPPQLETVLATPLVIERDPLEFRGTAGILLDATASYEGDDWVLIGNAACLLLNDLESVAGRLSASGADIAILAEPDGTPTGIMLVRCKTLRHLSPIGFVDLNEQALPAIAAKYDVRVLRQPTERYAIRNLAEYTRALRQYHINRISGRTMDDPFSENWISSFNIVEKGADVASSSSLLDSVVLEGGRVERDAVVVRSIVCPGATVRARSTVIDEIVTV